MCYGGSLEEVCSELGPKDPASAKRWREDEGESVACSIRRESHEYHNVHILGVSRRPRKRAEMRYEVGGPNGNLSGGFHNR